MRSTTKFIASEEIIRKAFAQAGISDIKNIVELSDGWFNRIYSAVDNDGKKYVIKFAPTKDAPVLTHEKNLMLAEVNCYHLLAEKTQVKTPKLVFADLSESVVPTGYFIMEYLSGVRLDKANLTPSEQKIVTDKIAYILSEFHCITGNGYGYEQIGLQDTWKQALIEMTQCLIADCSHYGKRCKIGKKLLAYIEKFSDSLEDIPCVMVNFDLHNMNIFCDRNANGEIELAVLDLERFFYGDPIGDFVVHDLLKPLSKKSIIEYYNKYAKHTVNANRNEEIRLNLLKCYLATVMYTERFSRFNTIGKYFNSTYLEGTGGYQLLKRSSLAALRKFDNE